MLRVVGLASSKLFVPEDPLSPLNRRISIIVMNREAEERLLKLAPGQADADRRRRRSGRLPTGARRHCRTPTR